MYYNLLTFQNILVNISNKRLFYMFVKRVNNCKQCDIEENINGK